MNLRSKRPTARYGFFCRVGGSLSHGWFPALVLTASCGLPEYRAAEHPSLQAPVTFAEGNTGKQPLESDPDHLAAEAERAKSAPKPVGFQPDPPAEAAALHHRFWFRFRQNQISVERVDAVSYAKPVALPAKVGRFAVELWIGKELLARSRFDFPLLGGIAADPPRHGDRHTPSLEAGADVVREVAIPENARATRAQLVDRATGRVWQLVWPPTSQAYVPVQIAPVEPAAEPSPGQELGAGAPAVSAEPPPASVPASHQPQSQGLKSAPTPPIVAPGAAGAAPGAATK